MSAYLIVDVDDLLTRLQKRAFAVDMHDLATRLRGNAALAAGLPSPDAIRAIAVANWQMTHLHSGNVPVARIFEGVGYQTLDIPHESTLVDVLINQYFARDSQPVDELILVTSSTEVISLISKIRLQTNARVRVWADVRPDRSGVIFQPLASILGIQSKTVAIYIDFENIAISLNEQGFVVNLDHLIDGINEHGSAHGQITHMAAYAPWGQRGSLPPLVDEVGREISDDAPSRLAMKNIDPVFNLPGKNSADMRIAKDVLAESMLPSAPDIFIIASGDRDFNEVFSALRGRNKQVIVWGVRGSTSRIHENNPSVQLEYLDDFLHLNRPEAVGLAYAASVTSPQGQVTPFTPSQWASVILQYDQLLAQMPGQPITADILLEQLHRVGTVVSEARGRELIAQAVALGILEAYGDDDPKNVQPASDNIVVERTRLVRDRIVVRVANTLEVRGWEYVNYGFLLKGIAMDHELNRPGLNIDDTWRSEWIDCLIREDILARELIPHRHNPEDLVPVIRLAEAVSVLTTAQSGKSLSHFTFPPDDEDSELALGAVRPADISTMLKRIVVSVDQFTSYRGFTWCPLGSLHRRLRAFDTGVTFQRAVEHLMELGAVEVKEYENPQSPYKTKGISLRRESPVSHDILQERDTFILSLLDLFEKHLPISFATLSKELNLTDDALNLWISIMQAENVLNPAQGKPGTFSLFRTHHTVNLVADSRPQ